jgi:hypothetical protein
MFLTRELQFLKSVFGIFIPLFFTQAIQNFLIFHKLIQIQSDILFMNARYLCIPAKLTPYSGQIDPLDTRLDFGQRA